MWPFLTRKTVQQELTASEQRILSQLATVDQLVTQLKKELIPDQQPRPGELRLQQLPREVAILRQQVQEIHTMLSHLAHVTPTGQEKSYHQDINDQVVLMHGAINSIWKKWTDGMDDYTQQLQQVTALMRDEADKHNDGQLRVEKLIVDMKPTVDRDAAD